MDLEVMLVKMNWESFRKMLRGADAEIREAQKRLAFADGNHPSIQLLIELLDQKSRLKAIYDSPSPGKMYAPTIALHGLPRIGTNHEAN